MLQKLAESSPKTVTDAAFILADGESVTGVLDLYGATLIGVDIPVGFTGTKITLLKAAAANATPIEINNRFGASIEINVVAGKHYTFGFSNTFGLRFVALESDATQVGDVSFRAEAIGH